MADATPSEMFGARLRGARRAARLTLAELSQRAGVHQETIGRVERGDMDPKLSTVAAIAAALEVSIDELFASSPPPSTAAPPEPMCSDHVCEHCSAALPRRLCPCPA